MSGGACSFWAAERVVSAHGTKDTTLLFADVLIEDEDLYRFIDEAAADVGAPLVTIADGRTIWELFRDVRRGASHVVDESEGESHEQSENAISFRLAPDIVSLGVNAVLPDNVCWLRCRLQLKWASKELLIARI